MQMVLLRRAALQALVAKCVYLAGRVDFKDACTTIGEFISLLSYSPFIRVDDPKGYGSLRMVESTLELPDELLEAIGNIAYMPPSVMPINVFSNSNAGWKTVKKSVFLNGHHHEGAAPLHTLSLLGSIPFSIDRHMLQYDESKAWENAEPNVVKQKELKKLATQRVINDMLKHGNKFYFVHRVDARYRMYASGYQISPQGDDYRKALLSLHERVQLTDNYNL